MARAAANGDADLFAQASVFDELLALQTAIVDGKRPQYRISLDTYAQLKTIVGDARQLSIDEQQRQLQERQQHIRDLQAQQQTGQQQPEQQQAEQQQTAASQQASTPGLPYTKTTTSGLNPIFLEKSDSLVRAEGQLKRQRIERALYEEVERRKHTSSEWQGILDVDNVLAKAQVMTPPVSVLKAAPVSEAQDAKSSFDENDYYSIQVESVWSANGGDNTMRENHAFVADFERLDGTLAGNTANRRQARAPNSVQLTNPTDRIAVQTNVVMVAGEGAGEDYIPQEPLSARNANGHLGQTTPPEDEGISDYEPGEISQISDEYTPEYAPPPAAVEHVPSNLTRVAHNQLTRIAAPQPSRVSPLAVHKNQSYELDLIDGRPEMVAQTRQAREQARQSSASPPAAGKGNKRQKGFKKRKRDTENVGRSKKRDRRSGQLDDSAQYPPVAKHKPRSPRPSEQHQGYAGRQYGTGNGRAMQPPENAPTQPAAMQQYGQSQATQQYGQSQATQQYGQSQANQQYGQPQATQQYGQSQATQQYGQSQPTQQYGQHPAQLQSTQQYGSVPSQYQAAQQYGNMPTQFQDTPQPLGPTFAQGTPRPSAVSASIPRTASAMPQCLMPREWQHLGEGIPPHHGLQAPVAYSASSPVAPYAAVARVESRMGMGPQHASALMPPPPAPKHVVVDQYGNKYYPTEQEPAPMRVSVAPEAYAPQYGRAPSRMSSFQAPPAQYDPANPHIEYLQSSARTAAVPSYTFDNGNNRMHNVPHQEARQYDQTNHAMPAAIFQGPEGVPRQYDQANYAMPTAAVFQPESMPPPTYRYVEPARQSTAPPAPQYYVSTPLVQATPRAYNTQPEYAQQMSQPYPPRQGSVAPVQYIRQSMQPEQTIRYVDQNGFEIQPSQLRQVSEYGSY